MFLSVYTHYSLRQAGSTQVASLGVWDPPPLWWTCCFLQTHKNKNVPFCGYYHCMPGEPLFSISCADFSLHASSLPIAIRLMVSARLGFSGSRIQVWLSISSRTSQNSVRDSRTSTNWLWSCCRVLCHIRPQQTENIVTVVEHCKTSSSSLAKLP